MRPNNNASVPLEQHKTYLDFDDIQQPQNYLHNQDSLLLLTNSDILLQNNEQNYFQKYSSLITKVSKIF